MISYLKHGEIDKKKWDLCIAQSVNERIYAYSWYLDIVSPDWEALVLHDYEAVFPLTWRKKIWRYLYTPFFTQQLGLFHRQTGVDVQAFLEAIPSDIRFADIQLNEGSKPDEARWRVKRRKNFLLDLSQSYEKISKSFSEPTRRNIKKAIKHNLVIKAIEPAEAVAFYVAEKSKTTLGVERTDYETLQQLLEAAAAHNMLLCRGVFDPQGTLLTTAAIYTTPKRLVIINNSTSAKGREERAMYHLVNELILQFSGQPLLLDFEGSDMEGIARFNKGFGAEKHYYYRLLFNRLPLLFRWLKG